MGDVEALKRTIGMIFFVRDRGAARFNPVSIVYCVLEFAEEPLGGKIGQTRWYMLKRDILCEFGKRGEGQGGLGLQ